jgi:hypothetical protein
MTATPPMKHYLLTLMLTPDWNMHAYVMAEDRNKTTDVGMLMVENAEKEGFDVQVPMIMVTELESANSLPRSIARENLKAARMMDRAKDLHYTAWLMSKDDPRHEKLMGLH